MRDCGICAVCALSSARGRAPLPPSASRNGWSQTHQLITLQIAPRRKRHDYPPPSLHPRLNGVRKRLSDSRGLQSCLTGAGLRGADSVHAPAKTSGPRRAQHVAGWHPQRARCRAWNDFLVSCLCLKLLLAKITGRDSALRYWFSNDCYSKQEKAAHCTAIKGNPGACRLQCKAKPVSTSRVPSD